VAGLHPNIIQIKTAYVNSYLIRNGKDSILVDTGLEKSGKKILQSISNEGLSPSDIKLIILTHPHYDHCMGARAIKNYTGAQILVHRSGESKFRKGHCRLPKGTNFLLEAWTSMGRLFMPWLAYFPSVEPDITIGEEKRLEGYGLDIRIVPTPGHTEGSITVILDEKHAILGDTVVNHTRTPFPPFADDPKTLINSWKSLIESGIEFIYPGHGNPFRVERLLVEFDKRRKKYKKGAPSHDGR
jgi:glyoxylase-like metal-dependent hydrolase (beta-lactamase superfamily II)